MPYLCPELPTEEVDLLNSLHPVSETIDLFTVGESLVFHVNGSFYFQRLVSGRISKTVEQDLKNPRAYVCTAYEVLKPGKDSILPTLLDQFQERHGAAMASNIVTLEIALKGKSFILMKLPAPLIRHLMAPAGGALKTIFKGTVGALRRLPMLSLYGNLPKDVSADTPYSSVFATTYGEGQLSGAKQVHYLLLQDVINHPSSGITLQSLAQWDSD